MSLDRCCESEASDHCVLWLTELYWILNIMTILCSLLHTLFFYYLKTWTINKLTLLWSLFCIFFNVHFICPLHNDHLNRIIASVTLCCWYNACYTYLCKIIIQATYTLLVILFNSLYYYYYYYYCYYYSGMIIMPLKYYLLIYLSDVIVSVVWNINITSAHIVRVEFSVIRSPGV